jgi:hypothetical protein
MTDDNDAKARFDAIRFEYSRFCKLYGFAEEC